MEHIATVLDRSMTHLAAGNGTNGAGGGAIVAKHPRSLRDLAKVFEERESHENPDVVLPLSELRLDTEAELVMVPRLGSFRFTDWSKRQMASQLGLKWSRWFENASNAEKAEELNRRFARSTAEVRVRTTKTPGDLEPGDGVINALVSPGFSPVKDSAMARRLVTALASVDEELALIRHDLTDRTTSFVVKVGKPYKIGGPGEVGDVWGGVLCRNSGVGFASLLVSMFLERLVCRNGMTAPLPDAVLLKSRHLSLDDNTIDARLVSRFAALPGRLANAADLLLASRDRRVDDVAAAVRDLLKERRLPAKLAEPIMNAYEREQHASAFGVSQAITLAAQDVSPELRLDLERAAGAYLAANATN